MRVEKRTRTVNHKNNVDIKPEDEREDGSK